MMKLAENEDLGLSLSLSFPPNPKSTTSNLQKLPWMIQPSAAFFPIASSADTCHVDPQMFIRGIDVNRSVESEEEDLVGISSPNSTVSSISGNKRPSSERSEPAGSDELEMERASSRGAHSDEDEYGDNSRKKLRLSKDQSALLEESFKEHSSLNPKQKLGLAKQLGLRPRQVEVWFQNRRARSKLKQTEMEVEMLKRCCERLTEEKRRLQKEVQELRTLKLSPNLYMPIPPPTTLTMCPSCDRVGPPNPSGLAHQRPTPFNPWAQLRPRSLVD